MYALIDSGWVSIHGKKCQPTRKLWGGEEIEFYRSGPRASPHVATEGPVQPVLHNDAALVIRGPGRFPGTALLEVDLNTGRTHQMAR